MPRVFTTLIATFTLICSLYAQVIPSIRCVEWERAGCDFSFPEPDTMLNVMNFGAAGNGVANDQPAIQNAINTLPGIYKVVFIPAGTYLLSSALSMKDSVILRGAGSDSTFLKINHSSTAISISGGSLGTLSDVTAGLVKGSQKITVANASLFTAGNLTELRESNGSWDTNPVTWATYSVGQIVSIDSVAVDTLYLHDPLRIDYDTALNPQIRSFVPRKAVSIECMNLERTDSSTAGTGYNIDFNYAENCRVIGVESNKSQGSHCMITVSSRITVSGCYFHDAYLYDGSGTKGYGVTLNNHAGLGLIVNNIFKHLRHAMMTKHGANGNVFAYNYSIEPFRNGQLEYPQDYCGDISLHGHYSYANLFEGNIVQNIYIDQTWGPSGPFNTMFRNRIELYGLTMTSAQTSNQNFVGNEITGTGYTFPFNHGAYTLTGSGHLEYGNNDNGLIVPTGTNTLNDNSYFMNAQPMFWNITSTWPSIGAPNIPGVGDIPAHVRYLAGQYTECSDPGIISLVEFIEPHKTVIRVFPNPFKDNISVQFTGAMKGNYIFQLYDVLGRIIQTNQFYGVSENEVLNIPIGEMIQKGMFFLAIANDKTRVSITLIKD